LSCSCWCTRGSKQFQKSHGILFIMEVFKYAKKWKKGSMRIAPLIKRANKMCIGTLERERERVGGGEFDTRLFSTCAYVNNGMW
jgi:hypothetical protein